MATHEEKINEFLKQMGFSAQLGEVPGFPHAKLAVINHMNVTCTLCMYSQLSAIVIYLTVAYVPKVNVAPFFRRLLALNEGLVGAVFSIEERDNTVRLRNSRFMEGLDFAEFKGMLDSVGSIYWQHAVNLIQEFQLPQQPG